ncbi:uncharacterized protein PAC_09301 [Phialocephala subalpina]|uniref:Rhodopsin domain-containing protein n=1 Tax=Phialocephala subalpina TaxID=576137 RepID=A0A1L7X307_9HELO|nr:uncharacterized protein PAC_09301 [Phialocephala subalpina]
MPPTTHFATDSRVPEIFIGTLVPTALASILVIARLYSKGVLIKKWRLDDTLIVIAWVLNLGFSLLNCLYARYGMGHHAEFMRPSDQGTVLKLQFASRLLFQSTLCISKLGICVFYHRVFQDHTSRILVYLIIGFLIISTIPVQTLVILLCHPVTRPWNFGPEKCLPRIYVSGISNILADVLLMAFVIPRILPLQIGRKQKISLLFVLSLGILVIVAASIRLVYVVRYYVSADLAWNGVDIMTWCAIETNVGLFCASAPCIRPLLRKITPRFMLTSNKLSGGLDLGPATQLTGIHLALQHSRSTGEDTEGFDGQVETVLEEVELKGTTTNTVWAEQRTESSSNKGDEDIKSDGDSHEGEGQGGRYHEDH